MPARRGCTVACNNVWLLCCAALRAHIDADHAFDAALADFEALLPRMRPHSPWVEPTPIDAPPPSRFLSTHMALQTAQSMRVGPIRVIDLASIIVSERFCTEHAPRTTS